MNVCEFRDRLVGDCSTFSRSLSRAGPDDTRQFLDKECDSVRYRAVPLIQINPGFKPVDTVEALPEAGTLHLECARIFRVNKLTLADGVSVRPYRHQAEPLAIAKCRKRYVLTTRSVPKEVASLRDLNHEPDRRKEGEEHGAPDARHPMTSRV